MAAQGEPSYLAAQSDPGSNSERSTDSPMPGSEDDLVAGAPLHSPEWSEERFRVDRKKLEAMLQGPYPQHVEVRRLGVEMEQQLLAYATATETPDPSCVCDLHHS